MACSKKRSGNSMYSEKPPWRIFLERPLLVLIVRVSTLWSSSKEVSRQKPFIRGRGSWKAELLIGRTLDEQNWDYCLKMMKDAGHMMNLLATVSRYPRVNLVFFFHPFSWKCATGNHNVKAGVVSLISATDGSVHPPHNRSNAFLHWTEFEKLDLIGAFLINDDVVPGHWESIYLPSLHVHLILKAEDR